MVAMVRMVYPGNGTNFGHTWDKNTGVVTYVVVLSERSHETADILICPCQLSLTERFSQQQQDLLRPQAQDQGLIYLEHVDAFKKLKLRYWDRFLP
jgi:hypothetical protein